MELAVKTLVSLHVDDWRLMHLADQLRDNLTRPLSPAHRETSERILAQVTHKETTVRWQIIVMSWRRTMVDAYLEQGDMQKTTDVLNDYFTRSSGNGANLLVKSTPLPHLDLFRRAYLAIQEELVQLNGREGSQALAASLALAGSEKAALKKMTESWDRKMIEWFDAVDVMAKPAGPVADKIPSPAPISLKRPLPSAPEPARAAPTIREISRTVSPEIARTSASPRQLPHPDKATSVFRRMLPTCTNDQETQASTQPPVLSPLPSIIQQRIAQGAAANAAKLKIQMEGDRVAKAKIALEEAAIEQERERLALREEMEASVKKKEVEAQLWRDGAEEEEEERKIEEAKSVAAATADVKEASVPVASTSAIPIVAPVVHSLTYRSPARVRSSPAATPRSSYYPTPAQRSALAHIQSFAASAFQYINSTASTQFEPSLDLPPPFQQPNPQPAPTGATIVPSSSPDVIPATAVDTSNESTAADFTTTTVSSTEAPSAPREQQKLLPSLLLDTMEDSMRELPSQPLHIGDYSSLEDPSTEEASTEELIVTQVIPATVEEDEDVEMVDGGVSQKSFRQLMGEANDGLDDEEALANISELVAHDSENL